MTVVNCKYKEEDERTVEGEVGNTPLYVALD